MPFVPLFQTFSQILTLNLTLFIHPLIRILFFIKFLNFFLIFVKYIKRPAQHITVGGYEPIWTVIHNLWEIFIRRKDNWIFSKFLVFNFLNILGNMSLLRLGTFKNPGQILFTIFIPILSHSGTISPLSFGTDMIFNRSRRFLFFVILRTP